MENKMNYWAAPAFFTKEIEIKTKANEVINHVCKLYGIELSELMSKSRLRELVEPRQILFYILHKKLNIPCQKVGAMFGKNHATVLHGAKNIKNWMPNDKPLRSTVNGIMLSLDFATI